MKSSDLMLDALQTPLLASVSSAGVLVLACHFGPLWLVALSALLFWAFARVLYRRVGYLLEHGFDGRSR